MKRVLTIVAVILGGASIATAQPTSLPNQPAAVAAPSQRISNGARADDCELVNEATRALREAEATREESRLEFARARIMYEEAGLTKRELDAARRALETAVAQVVSARVQLLFNPATKR